MSSVPDLDRLLDARDRFVSDLELLPRGQLTARPEPSSWSALEVFEHLVLAELAVLRGCPEPAALEPVESDSRSALRRFAVGAILRLRIPVQAPSPAMLPVGDRTLSSLKQQWTETFAWISTLPAALGPDRLRLPYFVHPVAGALTLAEAVALNEVHIHGHRRQVRRIAESLRSSAPRR